MHDKHSVNQKWVQQYEYVAATRSIPKHFYIIYQGFSEGG